MKPIAQLLREKGRQSGSNSDGKSRDGQKQTLSELERKIAELEDNSEDSASESSDDSSDSQSEDGIDEDLVYERDSDGNIIRIKSSLAESDAIAPLPAALLPTKRCNFAPGAANTKKRKISFDDEKRSAPSSSTAHGFLRTVQEAIQSYTPASHDRKPFYCRVCVYQAADLNDFTAHQKDPIHLDKARQEQRVCFCKLCRKQFTSPHQLNEHLKGKAHQERLSQVRQGQAQRSKFS